MRLIDADKLIAELRKSAEYHKERRLGYYSAITHIKEQPTIEVPRWIPVTERLPKPHTNVFVYRPKMAVKFMVSYFGCDCFCDGAMDLYGNKVITHWMPLPTPPEDGDSE